MSVLSLFLLALLPLAAAPTAAGADFYVDAVNGDDANTGASPASAWRTISHATAVVPSGGGTIHIAPGLYDSALGESFPRALLNGVALVGDQGSAVTVLDGGGSNLLVGLLGSSGSSLFTSIRGLTLRNADSGFWVSVFASGAQVSLALEDVVIEGSNQAGFYGEIWNGGGVLMSVLAVALDNVHIEGCGAGVQLYDDEAHNSLAFEARDCSISGNSGTGVDLRRGLSTHATYVLERCRIAGNAGDGIVITESGGAYTAATIASSLIADNAGDGVRGSAATASSGSATLVLCTLARNGGSGVHVPTTSGFSLGIQNCILYDNTDDVADPFGNIFGAYCDIGDGDFAGSNGNFSADPLFRAPLAGDYRLAWGSPCIDAGDPALPAGTPDLLLVRRPIDGNLDIAEIADVGAFEFTPLASTGAVHIGASAVFEHWGPSGGRAILYASRGEPMPVPLSTSFGDFDLDSSAFRNLGTTRVLPGPPALRVIPIPNDPLYVGQVFSFQALSSPTIVLPTAAYTNPVTITILP